MSTPPSFAMSPHAAHPDFVAGDLNALAMHMRDCARAHGRMSAFKGGLQRMHAMAAGRIVTFVVAAAVIGMGVVAIA